MSDRMSVLVVDDEVLVLDFIEKFLSKHDIGVVSALSADEAIKKLEEFTPDVMILDIGMPGTDGYDLAEQIRGDEKFAETPIIFLSGYDMEADNTNSFASGGNLYIRKPISGELLVQILRSCQSKGCGLEQRS